MTARGLHVLTGGAFEHRHPECAGCAHREPSANPEFLERCAAKNRLLCCPKDRARRCKDHQHRHSETQNRCLVEDGAGNVRCCYE